MSESDNKLRMLLDLQGCIQRIAVVCDASSLAECIESLMLFVMSIDERLVPLEEHHALREAFTRRTGDGK